MAGYLHSPVPALAGMNFVLGQPRPTVRDVFKALLPGRLMTMDETEGVVKMFLYLQSDPASRDKMLSKLTSLVAEGKPRELRINALLALRALACHPDSLLLDAVAADFQAHARRPQRSYAARMHFERALRGDAVAAQAAVATLNMFVAHPLLRDVRAYVRDLGAFRTGAAGELYAPQ